MRVYLTPKGLINLECCLICPGFRLTTVCCDHDECCAHLQRVSDHVLDEIPVPGCNDDGDVPLVREGLFVVQAMVTPYSHLPL